MSTQSTQYDDMGKAYMELKKLPLPKVQDENIQMRLGNINGHKLLDLATGSGYFALKLIDWGARDVTGIDISSGMIATAHEQLPPSLVPRLRYFVGDVTQPDLLASLGLADQKGSFDTVFGGWLLHYASNVDEMTRMFRNAFDALKPGGRFVTISVNASMFDRFGPNKPLGSPHLGVTYHVIDTAEHGYKMRVTGHVEPKSFHFDCYFPKQEVYEKAGKLAGFPGLEWYPTIPSDKQIQAKGQEWWAPHLERPKDAILIATKPEM